MIKKLREWGGPGPLGGRSAKKIFIYWISICTLISATCEPHNNDSQLLCKVRETLYSKQKVSEDNVIPQVFGLEKVEVINYFIISHVR